MGTHAVVRHSRLTIGDDVLNSLAGAKLDSFAEKVLRGNCGKTGLPIIARFAGDPITYD